MNSFSTLHTQLTLPKADFNKILQLKCIEFLICCFKRFNTGPVSQDVHNIKFFRKQQEIFVVNVMEICVGTVNKIVHLVVVQCTSNIKHHS